MWHTSWYQRCLLIALKLFYPKIISENQSAFLSEQLIIDNVLVAFELMHYLDHQKEGKESLMAIKLDISDEAWLRQSNWTCPDGSKFLPGYLHKWEDCSFQNGHQCGACHNISNAQVRTGKCFVKWKQNSKITMSVYVPCVGDVRALYMLPWILVIVVNIVVLMPFLVTPSA